MVSGQKKEFTLDEWNAEGTKLFGDDKMKWAFKCPSCGHVATVSDWKDAGAPEGAVAFSCVGRYLSGPRRDFLNGSGEGPCNYAGGGLFKLNPVTVDGHGIFDFASQVPLPDILKT